MLIWRSLQVTICARQKLLNMSAAVSSLGYAELKSYQARVIKQFVSGHDVFGVLPTGYGRSLCNACLPLIFNQILQRPSGFSIVLIVSPLIALMRDQVKLLCIYAF